jgi:hypothetical protein
VQRPLFSRKCGQDVPGARWPEAKPSECSQVTPLLACLRVGAPVEEDGVPGAYAGIIGSGRLAAVGFPGGSGQISQQNEGNVRKS